MITWSVSRQILFQCSISVTVSQLAVSFELERYLLSVFFQSYFPGMIMVILGGLSMFLDAKSVPARVSMGKSYFLTKILFPQKSKILILKLSKIFKFCHIKKLIGLHRCWWQILEFYWWQDSDDRFEMLVTDFESYHRTSASNKNVTDIMSPTSR